MRDTGTGAVFRISVTGTLISLVFLLLFGSQLAPLMSDGQQLVRIRNSLLFKEGGTFDWQPGESPSWFRQEDASPPPFFKAIASNLYSNGVAVDEFEKALLIVRHLHPYGRAKGGMLATSTKNTYQRILETGQGYCADYTQVFTALALASNIPVREWGISFDQYSGDGHAFNEIYSAKYSKWIFLDAFNGFYVVHSDGTPLSYEELKAKLLSQDYQDIRVLPVEPNFFPFPSHETALDYLSQGASMSYLWTSNALYSYEANALVQATSKISRYVEQAAAILAGVHPGIMLDSSTANPDAIRQLSKVRTWAIGAIISSAFLATFFIASLICWLARRKRLIKSTTQLNV